jgi:hypothetical protein
MNDAFLEAGFFAAHSVWCVSTGETLVPILAYQTVVGERRMMRIGLEELTDAVALGQKKLAENSMESQTAVLIYDGYANFENGKFDALMIEVRDYDNPSTDALVVFPYEHASTGGFQVHQPRLVFDNSLDLGTQEDSLQSFANGIETHPEGSRAVW